VQFCKRLNGVNVSKVSAFLQVLFDDNLTAITRNGVSDLRSGISISPRRAQSFTERRRQFHNIPARPPTRWGCWLYRKYLKGQLPMKQSWNGEYTHDKELSGGIQ
jgi:hypothetical protein